MYEVVAELTALNGLRNLLRFKSGPNIKASDLDVDQTARLHRPSFHAEYGLWGR